MIDRTAIATVFALAFVGCAASPPAAVQSPVHGPHATSPVHASVASPDSASVQRPSQDYRDEHGAIVKRLDLITKHARSLDPQQPEEVEEHIAHVMRFFKDELLPHAAAEQAILYAKADAVAASKAPYRFTESMRYEHSVVHREVAALEDWVAKGDRTASALDDFGNRVTALAGLVHAHFGAEEDVVLAALDTVMTREQFHHEVVEPLEAYVREHGGGGHHGH